MAIFDVNNPPAFPDSTLDPDLTLEQTYNIQDDGTGMLACSIAPGDWIDCEELPLDPDWGSSFQVCRTYPLEIGVMMWNPETQTYGETVLDTALVSNNFRRVPRS